MTTTVSISLMDGVTMWHRGNATYCICHCLQDYPSIYQVRQLLIERDVIIVFATTDDGLSLYEVRDFNIIVNCLQFISNARAYQRQWKQFCWLALTLKCCA